MSSIAMSFTPPNTQGIRPININNPTSSSPHPTEVVYVDIYTDRITKEKFILWDDVRLVFHSALHVRHKARVVPFMKDDDFNAIKPFRIAVIPGEILDIFVGNPHDNTPQQRPSVLRQIEQQAARLPRHNPLSTIQPISATHPSTPVLNPRFRPPGNNFPRTQNTRQQLDEAAVRVHNKELARNYAKGAMTKIADTMDLDALHRRGDANPADFWKALKCYLKAVHQSHAYAQVQVGDLFFEGQDVSKDSFIAMGWYHKAAFQGDTNAQRKVEAHRLFGRLIAVAPETPTSSILKAQHNSSETSVAHLSSDDNELQMSKEILPFANEALSLTDNSFPTKHVASQSDIDGQVILGDNYMDNQDYQAAMECYLKAANQGHPVGQRRVGFMYDNGEGVTQNYSTAMRWYLQSANQGDANAQLNIGTLYKHGLGVPQDFSRAMNWYQDAANHGLAEGQYRVGCMYSSGEGTGKDDSQAVHWFLKAVDQGHVEAQRSLHLLYPWSNCTGIK